jgi:FAD/FMN-containing dehydrogenase
MIKRSEHEKKVRRVRDQLRRHDGSKPVSLRKKAVSHQVPKPKDLKYRDEKIDISDLNDIIEIDPEKRICVAEPGITFSDLVDETLRYGLTPVIVPELSTITIGGAVAGCSIESMSFMYGGFHDTCLEYEVITAKGDVLICSPDNDNSLTFQMMHGTFGTLGIISSLKFKLIPAKPYVKVNFERYVDLPDFKEAVWNHYRKKDIDFMDGFIHGPDLYVINAGNFADDAPYTHEYGWMRVFYRVSKRLDEDFLKLRDYYFRYDSGVTNVKPYPARLLLGKLMRSNEALRLAERLHSILPSRIIPITLDTFIPFSKLDEFLDWYGKEIGHYPLWVVPYRRVRNYEWISDEFTGRTDDELFIDLAIYGMKKSGDRNYYRLIEEELMEIGGIKTLISNNYYSESDFWRIWNRENYYRVKSKTDPDNIFRDLYTKTCRSSMGLGP